MSIVRASSFVLLLALGVVVPAATLAQQPAAAGAPAPSDSRELDGHRFVPSAVVADPFPTFHLGSETGFGYAQGQRPNAAAAGGLDHLAFAGIAQAVNLQVRVLPVWALRLRLSGRLFAGINGDAVLGDGIDLTYGVSAGTVVSFRLGRFRVGGAVDGQYSPTYNFNIFDALDESVNQGRVSVATLLSRRQQGVVTAAVLAAAGLHPAVGLTGEVRYAHVFSETDGGLGQEGRLLLGSAVSIDLGAVSRARIGISAGYRLGVPLVRAPGLLHDASLGIFYNGRPALVAGVEGTLGASAPTPSLRLLTGMVLVVLRHYF